MIGSIPLRTAFQDLATATSPPTAPSMGVPPKDPANDIPPDYSNFSTLPSNMTEQYPDMRKNFNVIYPNLIILLSRLQLHLDMKL